LVSYNKCVVVFDKSKRLKFQAGYCGRVLSTPPKKSREILLIIEYFSQAFLLHLCGKTFSEEGNFQAQTAG
jgi:hypothetical protein